MRIPPREGGIISQRAGFAGVALLLAVITLSTIIKPELINKLQGNLDLTNHPTFDVGHYINLASHPQCWAFYPLWPKTIRLIQSLTLATPAKSAIATSIFFFFTSLCLGYYFLKRKSANSSAFTTAFLLLILSPMNVFMLNGYSEALFSTISWILIYGLAALLEANEQGNAEVFKTKQITERVCIGGVFAASILIGYCRPTLPQVAAACTVVIIVEWLSNRITFAELAKTKSARLALLLVSGCAVGYSLYGIECVSDGNSFFHPFTSQSNDWDKSFGFRPLFLITSRSPIYDLWGLYFPTGLFLAGASDIFPTLKRALEPISSSKAWYKCIFLAYPPIAIALAAVQKLISRRSSQLTKKKHVNAEGPSGIILKSEKERFIFFYCATFSATHSAIVFLTQENYLYSLGRYIFGQPYFYVALLLYLPLPISRTPKQANIISSMSIAISACLLLFQMVDYGKGQWVG